METKDKLINLIKYQTDLQDRIGSKIVPIKHINRVKEYKAFLANELRLVTAKIEKIRLGETK